MIRYKGCFIFTAEGDYREVPYSELFDGNERSAKYKDRYFLPLGGYLMEVSREDYRAFYKERNRGRYLQKEAARVGTVPFDAGCLSEACYIADATADVATFVEKIDRTEKLHEAIQLLTPDEQHLIRLLYFEGFTGVACAALFGIAPSTLHERKMKVLEKLRNFLD